MQSPRSYKRIPRRNVPLRQRRSNTLSLAGFAGLVVFLLVLLSTCSVPLFSQREPVISGYVANPTPVVGPTVLPTVTPLPNAVPASAAAGAGSDQAASPPLAGVLVPATTGGPGDEVAERAARMNAYLAGLTQQGVFSGAVLVAQRGQVVLSRGYGLANREEAIPAGARTRFRLASVTKPLTAVGVMRLVAGGHIKLEASICTYLTPCPAAWQAVTVEHLLRQSSGIPNYTDFANFAALELEPTTPTQLVARFRELPLGFTPGTIYHYTNSNYVLLAVIIEQVTGMPYADYMQRELFRPLGMVNSGLDPGDFGPLEGTRGYAGGVRDIPLDVSNLYGSGDLYATVEDLYLFVKALRGGALLSNDLMERMWTPGPGRYAMGWMVEQRGERRIISHPGWMSGAATWLGFYPNEDLVIVVLSNNNAANVFAIADALAAVALE
ncbi:MAG: serine hydrolase domain-containing protein [Oscillochloridaceae bacterium umkhey_bin13]